MQANIMESNSTGTPSITQNIDKDFSKIMINEGQNEKNVFNRLLEFLPDTQQLDREMDSKM